MIVIEVKIPQWKDITKWFWGKFCFPRRKLVAEDFEWYNDRIVSELIDYLHEAWDCYHDEKSFDKLKELEFHLSEIMKNETKKIISEMHKLK